MCIAFTVQDFIAKLQDTSIPESEFWLYQLDGGFRFPAGFYRNPLTAECVAFIVEELEMLISKSLTQLSAGGFAIFESLWNGHMLLQEARQKAVGLGVDIDCVFPSGT